MDSFSISANGTKDAAKGVIDAQCPEAVASGIKALIDAFEGTYVSVTGTGGAGGVSLQLSSWTEVGG